MCNSVKKRSETPVPIRAGARQARADLEIRTAVEEARDALTQAPILGTRINITSSKPAPMIWSSTATTGPDEFCKLNAQIRQRCSI